MTVRRKAHLSNLNLRLIAYSFLPKPPQNESTNARESASRNFWQNAQAFPLTISGGLTAQRLGIDSLLFSGGRTVRTASSTILPDWCGESLTAMIFAHVGMRRAIFARTLPAARVSATASASGQTDERHRIPVLTMRWFTTYPSSST